MPRTAASTWVVAAAAAALLHGGAVALAYAQLHADVNEADLGSQAIEISLEATAPRAEQSDLPPGPEAEDAAASTAQVEQQAKADDAALPKETPTETPDPDRAVAPKEAEKPKDEPTTKAQPTTASAESAASEAAAPPPAPNAREAARSAAPAVGVGDSARRVETTWQRQLVAFLDRHKRYPADAPAQDAEILVSFTIDRTGHVTRSAIVRGSGSQAFDEAALAMMRRSDPVPAPPPLVADEHLTFTVPVMFRRHGARG